jgi:hypothetical protein
VLLGRFLLEIINDFPNLNGINAADLNKDGLINSVDYTLLSRYVLGVIDNLN